MKFVFINENMRKTMKKFILTLLLLITVSSAAYSAEETLSYWNREGQLTYYQNTYWQFALFAPEAPCYIKEFTLYFFGNPGQATIVLLGHEAGNPVPGLFVGTGGNKVLGAWTTNVNPEQGQPAGVKVELEEPVWFANDHFFIGVGGMSQGLNLLSDQTTYQPLCESNDGGNFYYQSLYNAQGQWALGNHAYAIDVVVDYPTKTPAGYLQDATTAMGFETGLSRASYAAADYDNNSFQDILISGRLYANENGMFTEVTAEAGLEGGASGNAFVDFDNDGDLDIIFFRSSQQLSYLFENDGEGNFSKTQLNIPPLVNITSFSIADINNDTYPDIFIGQLWGEYPQSQPNYLFINDGSNNVTDGTAMIYPDWDGTWNFPNEAWDPDNYVVDRNRNSRGSQWVDFDEDGDLDLYIANYFLHEDEFYRNNGDGSFTDICREKDIDQNETGHNHGTGVDWSDFDNDGDMDLLLFQFAHPRFLQYDHRPTTLYKNSGSPGYNFTDTYNPDTWTSSVGIEFEETHAGGAWGDVNNDGLDDFVVTTFYGCRYIDFYEQQPDNTFALKTFDYGLDKIVTGEDAAWVDVDNDGDLDLLLSDNRNFRIFENTLDIGVNNFVQVDLESTSANKYAIGARVKVFAGDDVYIQEVSCGRGQKMQKPYRLHFGISTNTSIDKISVRWPGKTEYEDFTDIETNSIVKLTEGGASDVEDTKENEYYLGTNTPNPFSDRTNISYYLPEGGHVKLSILNAHGVEIALITDEIKASGRHTAAWTSGNLESGVYFCRLQVSGFTAVKKMILVK